MESTTPATNGYPENVRVHGNGFIQIDLGGSPETRIHIWTEGLKRLTQNVNTQWHNHRFGFVSAVLRGCLRQEEMKFHVQDGGDWRKWQVVGARTGTGNRRLAVQPDSYIMDLETVLMVTAGEVYSMRPRLYHRSVPWSKTVVTLFTKTQVIPDDKYQASVFCKAGLEPDQKYDRRQIPFYDLLHEHIIPALKGTPLEKMAMFQHKQLV
jgi:hypothetical protein